MATDDSSTTGVTLTKRLTSRKQRTNSFIQSPEKPRVDEYRLKRTLTATQRPSSRLRNSSKTRTSPLTPEPTYFKQYRSPQREPTLLSASKLERQPSSIYTQPRLPTLYSLTSANDQKHISELRRRQIYALNHLMRELEQEQFRQFCTLQKTNIDKQDNTGPINGATNTN